MPRRDDRQHGSLILSKRGVPDQGGRSAENIADGHQKLPAVNGLDRKLCTPSGRIGGFPVSCQTAHGDNADIGIDFLQGRIVAGPSKMGIIISARMSWISRCCLAKNESASVPLSATVTR